MREEAELHLFLISALDESGQHHAPAALRTGNNPGAHWKGWRNGPRAGLDILEKGQICCPWRDVNTGPSSQKPGRYTDYAIPAPSFRW
jgi:hypothetical protein